MQKDTTERKAFVKEAIKNRKFVADKLRLWAAMLDGARTKDDIVLVMSEVLFLSERTILRDADNQRVTKNRKNKNIKNH